MKKIKKIFLIASLLVCSVFCINTNGITALADRVEVGSENKTYYGKKIDTSNINEFIDKGVTYNATDLETPFLEFYITPSQMGTSSAYTPDFEKIDFDIYDANKPKERMKISIYQQRVRTRDESMGEQVIAINVAGGTQSLNAEYRGDWSKWATDYNGGMPKGVLAASDSVVAYCGQIGQSFDGYVHSTYAYVDEDGVRLDSYKNKVSPAIRLYYDRETNAIYTDVGYENYATKITMENGKRRWRIRDFDEENYMVSTTPATAYKQTPWAGFDDGADLQYTINFDKIVDGKNPCIFLSRIAGKQVDANPIKVESPSKGQTNVAYKVPVPVYYDKRDYSEVAFEDSKIGGVYAIYKLVNGNYESYQTYRAISSAPIFTPTEAGTYLLRYRATDIATDEQYVVNEIYVTVEDNPEPITITEKSLPDETNVNTAYDVGAFCSHPSQVSSPNIYLTIKKDGETKLENVLVGETYEYMFEDSGFYNLTYTCEDYLGRVATASRTIDVKGYYTDWVDGIKTTMSLPKNTVVKTPSPEDLTVFDILYNQYVEPIYCTVSVSYNNGEYKNVSEVDFNKQGNYSIRYNFVYNLQGQKEGKALRNIYVYDAAYDPIKVNGVPQGTQLLDGESSEAVEVNLKAIKGQKIVIKSNYFTNATAVLMTDVNGTTQDITTLLSQGDFQITPSACGIMEIMATKAETGGQYTVMKKLKIDVREKWVVFLGEKTLRLPIGGDIKDYKPLCMDFYGNVITDYSTEIYYAGKKVEGNKTVFDKLGIYKIVYRYSSENEIVEFTCEVTTFDEKEPVIKILSHKTSASKNEIVKLADYELTDDSGIMPQVTVYVTKDGKQVNVTNNSFSATEAGEYVVSYYAVDSQGRAVMAQYVVKVAESGCSGSLGNTYILILGTLVLLGTIKKSKNKKCY